MKYKVIEFKVHPKYDLLIFCDDCNEYKGIIYSKELNPELHKRYSDENNAIEIKCLCEGIKCIKCGRKKHRPISSYYDKNSDKAINVPYFTANIPCKRCKGVIE